MNTDIGGKKPYHFGNLKEALIEQGIALIHEEGIEKFSLPPFAEKTFQFLPRGLTQFPVQ